jgi:hypothetical protein
MWGVIIASFALNILLWWLLWKELKKTREQAKNGGAGPERETRVFKLYQEIEGMLDSFDQYVAEVHEELETERAALNETSRQAQLVLLQAMEKAAAIEKLSVPPVTPESAENSAARKEENVKAPETKPVISRLSDRDRQTLGRMETKAKRVRFLMSRGLAVDEVARELDIGIGEVRLIADLDRT